MHILRKEGSADKYPLFKSIHAIAFEGAPVESMLATLGCFELDQVCVWVAVGCSGLQWVAVVQ